MKNVATAILYGIGLLYLIVKGYGFFFGDESTSASTFSGDDYSQYEQPARNCHPSYSGCLNPSASDYDCAGGSGNGPYYTGRVRVVGPDVFGLDRDGDGWGCE